LDGDELTTVEMVAKKSRPRKRKPKGSGKGGSRKRRRGGNQGDGGDESSGSDEPGSQPSGGGEEPVPVDVGPPAADLPPGRRLPGPRRPEEPEEAELDLSEVASPVPRAPPSSRRPPLPLPTGVLTRDSVLMLRPPGSGLSLSTRPLGWTVKLESPNAWTIGNHWVQNDCKISFMVVACFRFNLYVKVLACYAHRLLVHSYRTFISMSQVWFPSLCSVFLCHLLRPSVDVSTLAFVNW
jgi:hypothetical protein